MGNCQMASLCEVCGTSKVQSYVECGEFRIVRCLSCGYVKKCNAEKDYRKLPAEAFRIYDFDRSREVGDVIKLIQKVHPDIRGMNLIEIGCGMGALLNVFRMAGMNVYGYEPSSVAVQLAKERFGISTIQNGYFEVNDLGIRSDIFLLFDVLEHLDSPMLLLRKIEQAMTQQSILVIRSGNPESFNGRLYPPRWVYFQSDQHIAFYSQRALAKVCLASGLELVNYYPFRHAYGGFAMWILIKNVAKALIFRVLPADSKLVRRFYIDLANDHFIAVIRKKSSTV